ncbi:MAG: sulfur carrier protein ThiS adenylyltransferase ThiF [Clostridium sp.]|uniref:sulfur carrier protein ThiS adenylyltransferase ThiF n=1 Tax=Clostridium sp. TaxID=1506 RepID=UPI0030588920
MLIKVNEQDEVITLGETCFKLRDKIKPNSDVIILNGFPLEADKELLDGDRVVFIKKGQVPSAEELQGIMMARHTPGVHEKVKIARVSIAGVGGLGSNIAISLARLGVSYIKIVDFDVVEPSNLNRQQYFVKDIGEYKVKALKRQLADINPFIEVEAIVKKIESHNVKELFQEVDIIIEAFDNPTYKAELCNTVLTTMKDKTVIASSGMAGFYSANDITTKKVTSKFYICGDGINEAKEGSGLMAPRVAICANHMANMALRIILGEEEI